MIRCGYAVLALASLVTPIGVALAADGPSINCGAASGLAETMVCSDAALGASDGRMAGHVDSVVAALEETGEGAEEAVAEFREAQAGWAETRDACATSTDPRACVQRAYATREAELVATYELAEPDDTVSYACSGAADISVSFYDLDAGAVRIDSGDDFTTGTEIATPDGTKYALSSGQEIWVRKDAARITGADGTTITCEVVRR